MDRHRGGRHDEALARAHRERHADRVAAAEHEGDGGLLHPRQQLGDREARLHVAAHRVEDDDQPLDVGVLLHRQQLGDDMLVFGRLVGRGQDVVPLDLPDDRQAVNRVLALARRDAAGTLDLFGLRLRAGLLFVGFGLVLLFVVLGGVLPGFLVVKRFHNRYLLQNGNDCSIDRSSSENAAKHTTLL